MKRCLILLTLFVCNVACNTTPAVEPCPKVVSAIDDIPPTEGERCMVLLGLLCQHAEKCTRGRMKMIDCMASNLALVDCDSSGITEKAFASCEEAIGNVSCREAVPGPCMGIIDREATTALPPKEIGI